MSRKGAKAFVEVQFADVARNRKKSPIHRLLRYRLNEKKQTVKWKHETLFKQTNLSLIILLFLRGLVRW